MPKRCLLSIGTVLVALVSAGVALGDDPAKTVEASGVKGGLIVVIGVDDAQALAEYRVNDTVLVHGLDTVVNLLMIRDAASGIGNDEIQRVLTPKGVAMVKGKKTVKPVPDTIDDWSHYLHGPDNNAVANDTEIGPPLHLQWAGPPRWTRHHNTIASISSLVSAGGRIFYVLDTGVMKPGEGGGWVVMARDAFNGIDLWRAPLSAWPQARFRSGPPQLQRLVVASEEHVYVPLELGGPVVKLDAATGKTVRTFDLPRVRKRSC